MTVRGTITRIATDSLVYVITEDENTVVFVPEVIDKYLDKSAPKVDFFVGQGLDLELDPKTLEVVRAYNFTENIDDTHRSNIKSIRNYVDPSNYQKEFNPNTEHQNEFTPTPSSSTIIESNSSELTSTSINYDDHYRGVMPNVRRDFNSLSQQDDSIRAYENVNPEFQVLQKSTELLPNEDVIGYRRISSALPLMTRKFGKVLNLNDLMPGDLLLTREITPDKISAQISEVQSKGGYSTSDSVWTHAAMYVGDDIHVVEATFDNITSGGNVRLTKLDTYCDGKYALRFRRSKFISNEREGWRICVCALKRLGDPYDIPFITEMWCKVVWGKNGFYNDYFKEGFTKKAVVCSTLYAEAYSEATRRILGEVNGICVPAWLSAADDFLDIEVGWMKII
jgi:hypothetical protein